MNRGHAGSDRTGALPKFAFPFDQRDVPDANAWNISYCIIETGLSRANNNSQVSEARALCMLLP
jgi:hypothetical protein